MNIPVPTIDIDYDHLRQAAETLGFLQEASLIDQKGKDLEGLFTLLVMGPEGAGKSTIINLLMQRHLIADAVNVTWLNIYRRPELDEEYAEIFVRDANQVQRVVKATHQQAIALLQEKPTTVPVQRSAIERIVWYVNTLGIPKTVALAELPRITSRAVADQYFWECDGILFVASAKQLDEEHLETSLSLLRDASRRIPIATLGVLTHMDAYPQKRWLQVLQEARSGIGKHLDAVVPCSIYPEHINEGLHDSNAMFLREIRYRFFASATSLREKNQSLFVEAMRQGLAERFEDYVASVLNNKWSYNTFRAEIKMELKSIGESMQRKIDRFIDEQKNLSLARAAALNNFDTPDSYLEEKQVTPTISQTFGTDIYKYISQSTQHLFNKLSFQSEGITKIKLDTSKGNHIIPGHKQALASSVSFKLPSLPLEKIALLCGEKGYDDPPLAMKQRGAEATLYREDPSIHGGAVLADEWITATEWVPVLAKEAKADLDQWLNLTLNRLQKSLTQSAEHTFRELHGFLPNETPVVLMPLEETYAHLIESPLRIPTPHLPGENLSPVLFLCRMQEAEFIEVWNKQLVRRSFDYVVPLLRKKLLNDIEEARKQLSEQWKGSKDSIQKRVHVAWSRYGKRLAMKSVVKWSIPWVSALMRDRLMDPVSFLSRSRVNVRAPYEYPVSLFLNTNSQEFLQSTDKTIEKPLTPDQFIADLLQQRVHDSASSIWNYRKSILISQPLRKTVRRRTTIALGLLFGMSILWVMMFGTSATSMWILVALSVPYITVNGIFTKRLIDRTYESSGKVQAQRVYEEIQSSLDERLDRLRDHINKELNSEELWEEVYQMLNANQTSSSGMYLSYSDLIKRLETMQRRNSHRKPAMFVGH